jgi:hypothetical protein
MIRDGDKVTSYFLMFVVFVGCRVVVSQKYQSKP